MCHKITRKMIRERISSLLLIVCIIGVLSDPVAANAAEIRRDEIKSIVINYVNANMPWASGVSRVIFKSQVNNVVVDGDRVSSVVLARDNEDFIGDSSFAIKFYSDGTLTKTLPLRVRIEVLTDVVTTVKPLRKGWKIAPGDVRVLKKWVRRMPLQYARSIEEVLGKALAVGLGINREITKDIVRAPLLVVKGNLVRILFDNESLRISTVGISEESGTQGEFIRVKALSSQKTIYAKVTGDSAVRVIF